MDRKQAESLDIGDTVRHTVDDVQGHVGNFDRTPGKGGVYIWWDDKGGPHYYAYADMCEIQLIERKGGTMKAAVCTGEPHQKQKKGTLSRDQVWNDIVEEARVHNPDGYETDNEGQLVIYTGIYRWKDGSYHNKAES
jgi:hypothetical protein